MKLSFVTTMSVLPWAGSEELWHGAALQLLEQGHSITTVYPKSRGWAEPLSALRDKGGHVHAYGPGNSTAEKIRHRMKRIMWSRNAHIRVGTRPRDWNDADLVVVSQGSCMDGLEWLELVLRSGRPYAIICQANMESYWPNDATAERLRRVYAAARKVCFVSFENERLFRIQTGYKGYNTTVVWNPLQPSTPANPLPWPANPDGIWRVAMVGRIEPFAKGQDLMLETLSQEKWRSRNLVVTLYGKGPWEQTARKIIADRNLKNVVFGGFSSPTEIWANHQILALPSRHEGMSLAMLEAMWLGRPVVATAVAGAASEIVHGLNGILAPAATVELWDQAMEEAWENRSSWQRMGEAAALRIRERMDGDPIRRFSDILLRAAGITGQTSGKPS